jgi:uncharacterized protein involved in exopolysaccharide biosynthesis
MAAQGAWAGMQKAESSSNWTVRRRFALADFPTLLWRERHLILAVFLVVLGLGVIAALAQKTSYQAQSSLLVSSASANAEIEILGGGQLPLRVIEKLGLSRTYPQLAAKASPAEQRHVMGLAAQSIEQNLRIESTAGTPIVRLAFSHHDPQAAALILNTLLEEYLIYRRSVLAAPDSAALDQQRRLSELQAQIERQRYETEVELQARTARLAALNAQLAQVPREVRLHRDVTPGAATRTRTGLNPVYQELQTYKIQLKSEVAALEKAEAALADQAVEVVVRRQRLAGLDHDVRALTVSEEQDRAVQEIALAASDDIRIIQRAAPPTRGQSLRMPVLALSLLLASLAGLAAGLVRMLLRPGLPTAEVASRTLDLPILGAAAMKPR